MYNKQCKWCNNEIIVEKQCQFALHVANCNDNPNKKIRSDKNKDRFKGIEKAPRQILKLTCPKCGVQFEQRLTQSKINSGKYRKFCSKKCSKGHIWSEEHKIKLSITCKNSEKILKANREIALKKGGIKKVKFVCQHCGEVGIDNYYHKNRKYHTDCWKKVSGGIRQGSSRGKHGWYKGIWCDSSYELAYIIFCLEHNIKIERNKIGYKYVYKNNSHTFFPDFRVDGKLVEIKNYKSELTYAKLKSVDEEIDVFYKDSIKPFLNYVVNKYGKNFIELYEK